MVILVGCKQIPIAYQDKTYCEQPSDCSPKHGDCYNQYYKAPKDIFYGIDPRECGCENNKCIITVCGNGYAIGETWIQDAGDDPDQVNKIYKCTKSGIQIIKEEPTMLPEDISEYHSSSGIKFKFPINRGADQNYDPVIVQEDQERNIMLCSKAQPDACQKILLYKKSPTTDIKEAIKAVYKTSEEQGCKVSAQEIESSPTGLLRFKILGEASPDVPNFELPVPCFGGYFITYYNPERPDLFVIIGVVHDTILELSIIEDSLEIDANDKIQESEDGIVLLEDPDYNLRFIATNQACADYHEVKIEEPTDGSLKNYSLYVPGSNDWPTGFDLLTWSIYTKDEMNKFEGPIGPPATVLELSSNLLLTRWGPQDAPRDIPANCRIDPQIIK